MLQRDRLRRELSRELSAQTAHWEALSRRLALYESQVLDQARGNAEASLLAYQNDRGDFADVMRAYIDDLNTRTEHLELKVKRAKAYSMLANLGGLNP